MTKRHTKIEAMDKYVYTEAEYHGCLLECGPLKGYFLQYWGNVREWFHRNYPERVDEEPLYADRFIQLFLKWLQGQRMTPGTRDAVEDWPIGLERASLLSEGEANYVQVIRTTKT